MTGEEKIVMLLFIPQAALRSCMTLNASGPYAQ